MGLGNFGTGRVTLGEVRDGSGDLRGVPGRVKGTIGVVRARSGELRDGSGDSRKSSGQVGGPSRRFGTGRGTLGED